MNKQIATWQMVGFVFTGLLGTVLHFFFDWTGGSLPAALVSAVNESIWEHMKLLFYPMVLAAWIEYKIWGREAPSFWWIKFGGILTSLVLIPVLYYTYTGALGVCADWFNITIFFLAAAAAYWLETRLFIKAAHCQLPAWTAVSGIILLGLAYTVLTFWQPRIPFFQDPVTGTYGFFQSS